MSRSFPHTPRVRAAALLATAALAGSTGCAATRIPTIEDHYRGGSPTDSASLPNGNRAGGGGPVAYHPTEVLFEPVVPLRSEPETIPVLELAHAGEDGTWIAPHYIVVLVRAEGWVGALPPTISEPLWKRPSRAADPIVSTSGRVGITAAAGEEDSR